ncbi:FtsX-like permease family protein [Saccharothrix sp. ALI-22-I]|uniref:FtsX-like permease family protein n=1 Tax=Saccharothrix sp. ALI-22-I TaxID=1933778 RepID=UPI0015C2F38C|nr:ABC transporter permease [Saccharothrix sp. ALI-22-I]
MLLGFAGIALFVGIFIILNTFSVIVAQRTRELALLRAIGMRRTRRAGDLTDPVDAVAPVARVGGWSTVLLQSLEDGGGDTRFTGAGGSPVRVLAAPTRATP